MDRCRPFKSFAMGSSDFIHNTADREPSSLAPTPGKVPTIPSVKLRTRQTVGPADALKLSSLKRVTGGLSTALKGDIHVL